ncbi:MAG: hypothetical protein JNK32_09695 [Anaerolineales bacterium]|nr:hypothetical protein [Anaerolineales bacterium]
MSPTKQHNDLDLDNQLAEFTDQVMEGKMNQTASPQDGELSGLEETILRLNRSFPPAALDDASSKQMLVRLKARMRREEQVVKPSFWRRLFDIQANPQIGMMIAVVAVLVLAVVAAPMFTSTGGTSVSGTASSSASLPIAAGLVVILLMVLLWFGRKK